MEQLFTSQYWPFGILILGVLMVVIMIAKLRFHPFIALILAAIFVGLITPTFFEAIELLPKINEMHPLLVAIELPMAAFGNLVGKIAWVIALAAIIGTAMMESGAADRIGPRPGVDGGIRDRQTR